MIPSPQTTVDWQGWPGVGQIQPGSTKAQLLVHPSPSRVFRSSQASGPTRMPSPQIGRHALFVGLGTKPAVFHLAGVGTAIVVAGVPVVALFAELRGEVPVAATPHVVAGAAAGRTRPSIFDGAAVRRATVAVARVPVVTDLVALSTPVAAYRRHSYPAVGHDVRIDRPSRVPGVRRTAVLTQLVLGTAAREREERKGQGEAPKGGATEKGANDHIKFGVQRQGPADQERGDGFFLGYRNTSAANVGTGGRLPEGRSDTNSEQIRGTGYRSGTWEAARWPTSGIGIGRRNRPPPAVAGGGRGR